jgi:hypothetical protein
MKAMLQMKKLTSEKSSGRMTAKAAVEKRGVSVGCSRISGLHEPLGFMLSIPVGIVKKTFTSTLAFMANRFAVFFNYVPLTVADSTNHFSLPVSTTDGTV